MTKNNFYFNFIFNCNKKIESNFPPPFFLACCGSKHDTSRRVLYACDRQDEERTTTSSPLDNDANRDDDNDDNDDDDGNNDPGNVEDKKENAGVVVPGEEDLEAVASLLASRLHVADRRWAAGPRDRCAVFWSSGTTGSPKGIPKSHQQLLEGLIPIIFP
jgi:acyl-coenzyme A synthetase/AMP-(fatty) acid ligase